jgi:cell division septal protein FtsQ
VAAVLVGLLVFLGCFWLWFRDSPFVSISRVQVTGLSGPGIPQIRQALSGAAMRMSTLNVDMTRLRAAVDPYPDVKSLTVQTQFPHGVVIRVNEQVPIAEISLGGRTVAISRDGTLIQPTTADSRLPLLSVGALPAGNRLTQAGPRAALAVLAAAPYSFLRHVESVSQSSQNGLVAQLRDGPQVRFGDTTQLHAKWVAALAVLGDATSQGAPYIDVTYPGRPAAGAPTTTTTTATTAASTTTTTPGANPGTTAPTTSGPG